MRTTLLLASILVATASAQTTRSIGDRGAEVGLSENWTPKVINAAMGDDQFIGTKSLRNSFLVLLEFDAYLENEADFRRRLQMHTAGIEASGSNTVLGKFTYRSEDGVGRAHQPASTEMGNGVEIRYDLTLVGRDGLGYLVLLWGADRSAGSLKHEGDRIANALRFPPPDSDWGRSTQLRVREKRFDGYTLRIRVQDSVFKESTYAGDAFFSLATAEDEIVAFFLTLEDMDLDDALDAAHETLVFSYPDLTERKRSSTTLAGREARLATCATGDESLTMELAAIQIAPGLALDFRVLYEGPPGVREELYRGLLESLVVVDPPTVDAFPVPEATPDPPSVNAHQREWLEAARLIGWIPAGASDASLAPGDGILVAHEDGVDLLRPGADDSEPLRRDGEWQFDRRAAACAEETFMVSGDGELVRIADGTSTPTGARATAITAAPGGGLFLVRAAPLRNVAGIGQIESATPSTLVHRRPSGDEVVISSFVDRTLLDVATDASTTRALVTSVERSAYTTVRLTSVDLGSGAQRTLGEWTRVRHLGPAPNGWLVTGTPVSGATGIWRVAGDGAPELLVSGPQQLGVALRGGELVLTSSLFLAPHSGREGRIPVYSIAVDDVLPAGPRCAPWTAAVLGEIGSAALGEHDPFDRHLFGTRASITRFLDEASRASERSIGAPLPRDIDAFDPLLAAIAGEPGLGQEGALVLVALLSNALLEQGAEWIDAVEPNMNGLTWETVEESTDLCLAVLPAQTVALLLEGESQASWIVESAAGRSMLIGTDAATLRTALAKREGPDWWSAVEAGDAEELLAILAAHPENLHLRDRIYAELARREDLAPLGAVAGRFARSNAARAQDLLHWFAARHATDGAAPTVEELRNAIGKHPRAAGLYHLLGLRYELTGGDQAREKARVCFERALELSPWGNLAEQVQAGLGRTSD
ncbi:MAG: hypothetical protein GY711_00715 [bacterium]|nr:hypothetical protein [bacterium]